jgi:cysteine-rich repeat protein
MLHGLGICRYVIVFDSFGASTDLLQDTLTIGDSTSTGRRLLATAAELFNIAKAKMADNLKAFSASKVNKLAASMSAEGGKRLDRSEIMALKGELLSQIQEGTTKAIGTTSYACETFSAAAVVSDTPSAMNTEAVLSVANVLGGLADIKASVMDQNCANAAVAMAGNSLIAQVLGNAAVRDQEGITYMNKLLDGMQSVMKQAVMASAVGEEPSVFVTDGSVQSVSKLTAQALMGAKLLTNSPSASSVTEPASFQVPGALAAVLGDALNDMIMHMQSLTAAPAAIESTTMVSPLYGLTFMYAKTGNEAIVRDLSEPFIIEIPVDLQALSPTERMLFPQQASCVYWNGSTYVSNGCNVTNVTDTKVTCSCNHLTTFGINQDPRIPACGDSSRTLIEGCDDGNIYSGDGCSDECTVEKNWDCFGDVGFGSTCLSKQQPTNNLAKADGVRTTMQFGGFDSENQVLGFLKSIQATLAKALSAQTGGTFPTDNIVVLTVCFLADLGCTIINKEAGRRDATIVFAPANSTIHNSSMVITIGDDSDSGASLEGGHRRAGSNTDIAMHIATPGSITPASVASVMSSPSFLPGFASALGAAIGRNISLSYKVPPTAKMAPRTPDAPLVVAPFVGKPKGSEEELQKAWTPPESRVVWGLSPVVVGLIAAAVVSVFCAGLCAYFVVPFHRRMKAERKHIKVQPMHFDTPYPKDDNKSDDSSLRNTYFSPGSQSDEGSAVQHLPPDPPMTESALGPQVHHDPVQRIGSLDGEFINNRTDSDSTAAVALTPRRPPGDPIRPAGGRFGHARARLHDLQAQLVRLQACIY